MFLATRNVLVATARTCSGRKPRRRSPNFARQSKACSWEAALRFFCSSSPAAKRTICLNESITFNCPLLFSQIWRRKLLEPKSTEARTFAGWVVMVDTGGGKTQCYSDGAGVDNK
ncbi:Uncharacterised protein [Neisseria meningitidis]|nr:Uncharacterised protein [Neisseria meningitidis]